MVQLIKVKEMREGLLFCRWLHSRLIVNNKNVLGAELGATGSGKSYRDLRKAELWYKYHFKEDFPTDNICFGITKIMEKITSGKLRRGEILIFEEAGANLGSLDFQSRVSKIFTYVLQSFRSMNIAIFFNLPYLSMLNKQARMLLHYSFESCGIDYERKVNICKPFFNQVNQRTGKIYPKYMRAKVGGIVRKFQKFEFSMPADYLVQAYEAKKAQYLTEMNAGYLEELKRIESDKIKKLGRKELNSTQLEMLNLYNDGFTQKEIAKKMNRNQQGVSAMLKTVQKYGYRVQKAKIPRENS